MDKILTNISGGFPFVLEDISFIQEATRKDIEAIIKSICGDGYNKVILYGLELNSDNNVITKGAIYYNGDVYRIPNDITAGGAFPDAYEVFYQDVYDPNGDKVFKDGISHSTYKLLEAQVALSTSVDQATNVVWREPLSSFIRITGGKWTDITSSFTAIDGGNIYARKRSNGLCEIRGTQNVYISGTIGAQYWVIGTMPIEFRPKQTVSGVMMNLANGKAVVMSIAPDGTIALHNDGVDPSVTLPYPYLMYSID